MADANEDTLAEAEGLTEDKVLQTFVRLGEDARSIASVNLQAKQAKALLSNGAAAQTHDIELRVQADVDSLVAYASRNRASLTDDGKTKTAELPGGSVVWRLTRSVELGQSEDEIVEIIRGKIAVEKAKGDDADEALIQKWQSFLREPKVTLNREAMLLDEARDLAAGVPGVQILAEETITVVPEDVPRDKATRKLLQRRAAAAECKES